MTIFERPAAWPPKTLQFELDDGEQDIAEHAETKRLSFELSYVKSPIQRTIHQGGVDAGFIDNAYVNESYQQSGEWIRELDDSEGDIVKHTLACAVQEAVHEALEWSHLDDAPILNPHGWFEVNIYDAVEKLTDQLFELAKSEWLKKELNP